MVTFSFKYQKCPKIQKMSKNEDIKNFFLLVSWVLFENVTSSISSFCVFKEKNKIYIVIHITKIAKTILDTAKRRSKPKLEWSLFGCFKNQDKIEKFSKRSGNIYSIRDLIDIVGSDSIRFNFLNIFSIFFQYWYYLGDEIINSKIRAIFLVLSYIYPKCYKNSNESCTFLFLSRLGRFGLYWKFWNFAKQSYFEEGVFMDIIEKIGVSVHFSIHIKNLITIKKWTQSILALKFTFLRENWLCMPEYKHLFYTTWDVWLL